jgi:signal transduction histidine kinase
VPQERLATRGRDPDRRWLEAGAVATWLVCAIPGVAGTVSGELPPGPAAGFFFLYGVYGLAMIAVMYEPRCLAVTKRFCAALVAVQGLAGTALLLMSAVYLGGLGPLPALLVIPAAELPHLIPMRTAWMWIGMQTILLAALIYFVNPDWSTIVSVALAIGGFQAFALMSSYLTLEERAARQDLARAHAALQAAQVLLAEKSRSDERLRISRDLHDSLGHHLTALSLQLDVASRLSDGKAAEHVQQAHAITRLLLSDVRDVVSTLRDAPRTDLSQAIRTLANGTPGLAIHFDLPPSLHIEDGGRAEALLRCVQEIMTNASRHAEARNLWIRLEPRPDGIALEAHDDGRGAAQLALGHGLTGMRERFAAFAGSVEFNPRPDIGFEVRGFMPTPHGAA